MNILYRMYCRMFQTVFKLAIPILPYHDPKILNNVSDIPTELKGAGADNVLIVTDKVLNSLGMLEPLKECLIKHGISFTVYDKTVPNPTVANVEEARDVYLKNGCKALTVLEISSAV